MKNQESVNKMILVSLKHNNITKENGFIVSWNKERVLVGTVALTRVSHAIKLSAHLEHTARVANLID
jgi:hypothetical protein